MAETVRWFCYMVRCKDESLYVGIATDLAERVKEHNWESEQALLRDDGQLCWFGGKSFQARKPLEIASES